MKVFLYVIEIKTYKGEYFYKVGEAAADKRPERLCADYQHNSKTDTHIIWKQFLPSNKKKRLNDKYVHKQLEALGYTRIDPAIVRERVNSSKNDGVTEVFAAIKGKKRLLEDIEAIMKKARQKDYSTKVFGDEELKCDKIKHLVTCNGFWFPNIASLLHKLAHAHANNAVLLIGQFDNLIINTFKMTYDNLIILSDDSDNYKANLDAFITNDVRMDLENYKNNILFLDTYNEVEELNMKFNLIISNPPYGKIGAEITDCIRENVDYDLFINLLPLTDYSKASAELPKYVIPGTASTIDRGAFEDARVTTAICAISKEVQNPQATAETLKLCSGNFGILNKFFERNTKVDYKLPIRRRNFNGMDDKYPVAIHRRDAANGHLPYTKTPEWKFNIGNISQEEYAKERAELYKGQLTGNLTSDPIFFDTKAEADNYKNFIYSKDGFRFTSMVWSTYKTDSSEAFEKCFPRVDWSKAQTVQSILKLYNYTDEEIAEVISELDDYKVGNMCK